jgi:ABC-2 type transport system ATP-binding protein
LIDVRHLVFEYPGLRALDDVTFSIRSGSITALVGPNGAGKTTLMRCVCGLDRPVTGGISVDGIDVIEDPRRSHERIGYLADFFGLYNDLTVSQCLRYAAEANGITRDLEEAIRAAAAHLNISDRLSHPAATLSRGLRQRVAIGQAIIHKPKVLVLDEPASGLDPEARHDLAQLFKHLQSEGMTLLVSSHILSELQAYASDMLVIRQGKIVEQRTLVETLETRRRLAIRLLQASTHLPALLEAHPDISEIDRHEDQVEFDFAGDARAQNQLLRELLEQGVPVTSFAPVDRDLQQSYLASMRAPIET